MPPTRRDFLWTAALAVSLVCYGALLIIVPKLSSKSAP